MRLPQAFSTLVLALLATSLAGCSGESDPRPDGEDLDVPDLGLQASDTTGVIRGVVVDEAIRPLAGVLVEVRGADAAVNRTTGDDGFFGFDDLAPGTYFVAAQKAGFAAQQTSVEVEAGVEEPPVVKILLIADASTLPYVTLHQWEGYIQCGLSVVALCGAAGEATNDKFATTVVIDGVPLLVQSEAVWDTTTAASDQLWLWHSNADKADGSFNGTRNAYAWRQGPSPLVMASNATDIEDSEYGTSNDLYLRMFTGSIDGTRNPLDSEGCYPGAAGPDIYCGGVGFSLQQAFTVYTTQFFGFLPPEGWLFADGEGLPEPPQ